MEVQVPAVPGTCTCVASRNHLTEVRVAQVQDRRSRRARHRGRARGGQEVRRHSAGGGVGAAAGAEAVERDEGSGC